MKIENQKPAGRPQLQSSNLFHPTHLKCILDSLDRFTLQILVFSNISTRNGPYSPRNWIGLLYFFFSEARSHEKAGLSKALLSLPFNETRIQLVIFYVQSVHVLFLLFQDVKMALEKVKSSVLGLFNKEDGNLPRFYHCIRRILQVPHHFPLREWRINWRRKNGFWRRKQQEKWSQFLDWRVLLQDYRSKCCGMK